MINVNVFKDALSVFNSCNLYMILVTGSSDLRTEEYLYLLIK